MYDEDFEIDFGDPQYEDYWTEQESYWEDDLYQLNQNEADDYRHEGEDE